MKKYWIALGFVLLTACSGMRRNDRQPSSQGVLRTHFIDLRYGDRSLHLRIGVQTPASDPIADILYIHGFADRLDNHAPLFEAWNRAGLRVIAFDLPSHGENSGSYNNLNHFDFSDLADLAAKVEQDTKPAGNRPLLLAGWSTGGLIAVRMLQKNWIGGLSRPVSGAVLFAPGVSVRKFPWTFGNRLGEVTDATLTHDPHPPHVGPIRPDTPFWSDLILGFSPKLVMNSILSQSESYPGDLKTLIFSGGDSEDMYAKAPSVRAWVKKQNMTREKAGEAPILGISCPRSMHELDNELPEYGGIEVRNTAAEFARQIAKGEAPEFSNENRFFGEVCERYTP